MIDKTPKLLKKITLNHIMMALSVLAENKVQMFDNRDYSKQKKTLSFMDGLFHFDRFLTSFRFVIDGVHETFFFQNKNYEDFYKKNKYSISDNSLKIDTTLAQWQSKSSKNFQKYVSKIVTQFERTKSVEISDRLLRLLPKLSFGDTGTFSARIEYSQVFPSVTEEEKMKYRKDFKIAKSKVIRLKNELEQAESNVLFLKQKLTNSKGK